MVSTPPPFLPAARNPIEVVERQAEVFSAEQLYQQILGGLREAIFALTPQREIVYANDAALALCGAWSRSRLVGMRIGEALGCWRAPLLEAGGCGAGPHCSSCGAARSILCATTTAGDAPSSGEIFRLTNELTGEARELRATSRRFEVAGQPFLLLALDDVTDGIRREVLERVFLHDVANTISGLALATRLLKKAGLDEHFQVFDAITRRLADEIRAQRTLLLAERGELVPQRATVAVDALLAEVERLEATRATERRQALLVAPGAEALPTLESDRSLLIRVLANLIQNAVEASKAGARITLGADRDGEAIRFFVHNPGEIPADVQDQLFLRSFSTKGPGRGVGTYSVKLLTERYLGGRVGFRSTAEEGTTFNVWVPLG